MASKTEQEIRNAVREHFIEMMSERQEKLRSAALMDLYYGPIEATELQDEFRLRTWPGYSSAVDELREWWSENGEDLWWDLNTGFLMTEEPQPWEDEETGEMVEPFWEEIYYIPSHEAAKMVFDPLISDGGM